MSAVYQGYDFLSYDMTVSAFDAFLERMTVHRIERMQDMGQASLYGQMTNESRRNTWNHWTRTIHQVEMLIKRTQAKVGEGGYNPILWNGKEVSIRGLVGRFMGYWGRGSVR